MPATEELATFDRFRFDGFDDAPERFARLQPGLRCVPSGLPAIDEHRDIVFVPAAGMLESATGGLFDRTGAPLAAALHRHGERVLFGDRPTASTTAQLPDPSATIDCDVLCLGRGFHHFGHMLLEGLARAFAIAQMPEDTPLLWLGITQFPTSRSGRRLLQGLGVSPDRLLHLDQPVRLRRVFVPRPALVYAHEVHRDVANTYLAIAEELGAVTAPTTDQPLYLSRAGLQQNPDARRSEAALESWLEREGIAVLRPETLDLRDQIATVNRHRHVFGPRGTALRLTFFGQGPQQIVSFHDGFPPVSSLQNQLVTGKSETFVNVAQPGDVARWLRDHGYARHRFEPNGSAASNASTAGPAAGCSALDDHALAHRLTDDPWDLIGRLEMTTRCRQRGDWAAAAEHAAIAARLHPLDPEIRDLAATMQRKAGRWARVPRVVKRLLRR
ncbi:MAG: glycosyltransferase family 61 protein [bacterium]|nr:glycosyltransferase family 61 protein [bacterium]